MNGGNGHAKRAEEKGNYVITNCDLKRVFSVKMENNFFFPEKSTKRFA